MLNALLLLIAALATAIGYAQAHWLTGLIVGLAIDLAIVLLILVAPQR